MSKQRCFIDIHAIQTIPPSCVNRDDTGAPKSCTYGGVSRARVSSQCWKRAARKSFPDALLGVRTLKVPIMVRDKILAICEQDGASMSEDDAVKRAAAVLKAAGVMKDKKDKKGKKDAKAATPDPADDEAASPDKLDAALFLSGAQLEALARQAITDPRDKKAAEAALSDGITADIAMFGRMVAANPKLNIDACVQVAHAISTHISHTEYDYFTAVDEGNDADETGAGHVNTAEFNSATLYRYACVDVLELAKALGDEAAIAAVTFIRCFLKSMPTGRINSFANFTLPGYVRICVRQDAPRSFAGAFEKPVRNPEGGFFDKSVEALEAHAVDLQAKYGGDPILDIGFDDGSLDEILSKVAGVISAKIPDGGGVA